MMLLVDLPIHQILMLLPLQILNMVNKQGLIVQTVNFKFALISCYILLSPNFWHCMMKKQILTDK